MSRVCLLYAVQRHKRWRGKLDVDWIARPDGAARYYDRHDPGLADELSVRLPVQDRRQQAGLKLLDLMAGIAQTGHFEDHLASNSQQGARRQCEKVDTTCGDIFSELSRGHMKALRSQLIKQLCVNQMDLTKVWLAGVDADSGAVFNLASLMRIALNAEPGRDFDFVRRLFRKAMLAVSRDGNDMCTHLVRGFPYRPATQFYRRSFNL